MEQIKFSDWLQLRESTPHKRARAAAAKGLLPKSVVGSIHGGATAPKWQVDALTDDEDKGKKKKKKDDDDRKDEAVGSKKKKET